MPKTESIEQKVDKIYSRLYKTKYSGNDKIHDTHNEFYASGKGEETIKKFIKEKLESGYDVKAGWRTTSVKGYHSRLVFYKKK